MHRLLKILDTRSKKVLAVLPLLLVMAGIWAFLTLAEEVGEGETMRFDRWAIRIVRRADDPAVAIGPEWAHEIGRDITALGGIAVLGLVVAITAGFLWQRRERAMVCLLLAASGSGLIVSLLLKTFFNRARPDVVNPMSATFTSSFPSGHSMLSAIVYLTLGTLLAESSPTRSLKVYAIAMAVFLTFIVGLSRVYMGVHYPTDVLAGWAAGSVWALACWLILNGIKWWNRPKV